MVVVAVGLWPSAATWYIGSGLSKVHPSRGRRTEQLAIGRLRGVGGTPVGPQARSSAVSGRSYGGLTCAGYLSLRFHRAGFEMAGISRHDFMSLRLCRWCD